MRLFYIFLMLVVVSTSGFARTTHESFAPLVERLLPTVVNVSTVQKANTSKKQTFDKQGRDLMKKKSKSLGSGVIIDKRGYVLTNNHVVANAEKITVKLSDNTVYPAQIIGRDAKTDLALLKIEAGKNLPYAKFGDSDEVRVGDWIIAIGNPFGLGGTVTAGIISAVARDIHAGPFDEFLQTDAAINRGSSGGPMFDMTGKVIGINTAIFSPDGVGGGNVGIGFAVPASIAEPVTKQLIEYGKLKRGWLGVKIQTVTKDIAESVDLKKERGALIVAVKKGSPAGKGGIKSGDILLEFDGKNVSKMRKLPRIVADTDIGKKVKIKLWRSGKPVYLFVKLGEMKEQIASVKPEQRKESAYVLKMDLAPLDDELRNTYSIPKEIDGIIVLNIIQGSEVLKYGMVSSDVIVKVNYKYIKTVEDFTNALKQANKNRKEKVLAMVYRRGTGMYFLTIPTDVD